ncbi:EthD family reductase [Caldalkalibacillus salinus]|uniref:EthD family reductase n=1 Tax=Caldalkalibacillus salinus TaxID=2803787 RepID=UPI0019247F09|nr:EthD family reductase [Caldalkalibacillus salinus]
MVKLLALYKQPENKESFNDHYYNVHTPLAKKMPGLEKVEVTEIFGAPTGESDYHLLAELYFKDKETLMSSMNSPEGKAAAKDLMGFAGPLVTMMFGKVVEN